MAFDQTTRNRLQRFVSDARRVLETAFSRQLQNDFGLDPSSGSVTPLENLRQLTDAQRETARILRDTLAHYCASPGTDARAGLDRIVREQAFTVLNRLAALRMAEARGLLIESVSNGYQAKGFQLYMRLTGAALGEMGEAYKCYLFSVFDELAHDLPVLFHRYSTQGRLFPRESSLLELLSLINSEDVAQLWNEDETIGWIYQYFNSKDERKKMRDESAAPRNSRELAVRNQFFTPRYVVEFLTDNTLGQIWYEMTQGQTRLANQCRYLIRRPNERLLKAKENSTEQYIKEGLTQEEILRQMVYVPNRPLKDPREIRMLDPACGSMHFGLYAFDLFEVIYQEGWELAQPDHPTHWQAKESLAFAHFMTWVSTFKSREDYSRQIPRLILEHNIHGIDIDPRAVQIAGLSLWLRAQRSWHDQGLRIQQRPLIQRSNIVCAEPMPGEERFLDEFIETHLSGTPEERLLGQLVRRVFEAMKLAGEAGSLLKIDEEIADSVGEAKQKWLAGPRPIQGRLFSDGESQGVQQELGLDLFGITDTTFWDKAEELIYSALKAYSERAEQGGSYQRRLFAEDTVKGFAFIDLCRKRFDAVLMNPPFGESSKRAKQWIWDNYPETKNDLLASFCERGMELLVPNGKLGEISSRVAFFLKSFELWRKLVFKSNTFETLIDLGSKVLDDAMVEAACYVIAKAQSNASSNSTVFRLVTSADKSTELIDLINNTTHDCKYSVEPDHASSLPNSPFIYWVSKTTIEAISSHQSLEPKYAIVRQGLGTGDNNRFIRLAWEVQQDLIATQNITNDDFYMNFNNGKRWAYHVRSGSSQPWYSPLTLLLDWENQGSKLKELWRYKGETPSRYIPSENLYFKAGFSWTRRAFRFIPYVIPKGCIPSASRYMAFPNQNQENNVLSLCASNLATAYMRFYGEKFEYPNFLVDTLKDLPCVDFPDELSQQLSSLIKMEVNKRRNYYRNIEPYIDFTVPALVKEFSTAASSEWDPTSLLGHDLDIQVAKSLGINSTQLDELEKDIFDAVKVCTRNPIEDNAEGGEDEDIESIYQNSIEEKWKTFLMYSVGCAFGRWNIRLATNEEHIHDLPDPFAPLPVCPPGQLKNEQGLPLTRVDEKILKSQNLWDYPIDIPWDGILVDDPGHPLDIETRVHRIFEIIWKDKCDSMERESCEVLGLKSLRDYFRKMTGFFAEHLKKYSKSRRTAPIYWPLSTPSGSYTIWIYYHSLSEQTLYTCINDFLEPRLRQVGEELIRLRQGEIKRSQEDEKQFEQLQFFEQELSTFRDELHNLTNLPWKPNLNDGVEITAAPLWRFFHYRPWQKALIANWGKLQMGDFDWSHIALTIWTKRVQEKCKSDKSLAIAHGLENLYIEPEAKPKKSRGRKKAGGEE